MNSTKKKFKYTNVFTLTFESVSVKKPQNVPIIKKNKIIVIGIENNPEKEVIAFPIALNKKKKLPA